MSLPATRFGDALSDLESLAMVIETQEDVDIEDAARAAVDRLGPDYTTAHLADLQRVAASHAEVWSAVANTLVLEIVGRKNEGRASGS
jgi:hypothetical protein